MEFHIFLPAILAIFLFLFMVVNLSCKSINKNKCQKLPLGPWKLPLIGNMHQLLGALPHHSLQKLAKKYGDLMCIQLGEVSTIVVSSAEMAEEIMRTHDIAFANRPPSLPAEILSYNSTGISFSSYGSYLRQMRKICTMELLSAKRVESFQSIREEEVSNLIKIISLREGSPINFSEMILSFTYGLTARAAFGEKTRDQEAYISLMKDVSKLAGGFHFDDMYPSIQALQVISGQRAKLEKLHEEIDIMLEKILKDHRDRKLKTKFFKEETKEDLVDVLLKVQKKSDLEHSLSDNNIKAVILDIFTGGSEPTSTTIEWAMSEILKNQKVMQKAQAEVRRIFDGKQSTSETSIHQIKFLKSIIKETLRLHPPVPLLLPRENSDNCDLKGYQITAKTKVIVNAWAIGRDPKYWVDAEKFQPERFLASSVDYRGTYFEFIPFGAGRRMCPGINFGIANIEVALAQLLYHFDWRLPNQELDMTETFGMTVRRKGDLYLIPTIYQLSPK